MQEKSDIANSVVEALRAESRHRTWFATVFAATISVTYVGSSFPFLLDQFPRLKPVGHFIAALFLFAASLGLALAVGFVMKGIRQRTAGLSILRTPSVNTILRELNNVFGMRVVAVALGGGQDGRIVAMRIKNHNIVGIGRGALSLIRREPAGFRYRLAHEFGHLAVGDPRRDDWLWAVYIITTLFLLIAYGSSLVNVFSVLTELGKAGGWSEVEKALFGWMRFGLVANLVLFGSILLALALERSSAARLREFYADAVATQAVGPVEHVFASAADGGIFLRQMWFRFLSRHPQPAIRAVALTDRGAVYRADIMLFVLQAFFSGFVLEIVLQLLFTSASAGLATFDDRRASLWRYFGINSTITAGIIALGALLAFVGYVIVLRRLAATDDVASEGHTHIGLIASVPLFSAVGTLFSLATSQGILWDLYQTGGNLPRYILQAWDRLTVHGVAFAAMCLVIISVFRARPRRTPAFWALGSTPILATLVTGYLLYR